jgi:hypothetical protein
MQMGAACMAAPLPIAAATIFAQHQTRKQQSFDSCTYLSAWLLARALRHQSLTGLSLSAPWLPPWTAQQRLLV